MHVALAGAGIGGLTAALALAARSVRVTLIEQSAELVEVGAGLQLSPNATRLLFELGLENELRAISWRPDAIEVRCAASRHLLLRTELGDAAEMRWGAPYLQVHRADLQALLLAATGACGQVRLTKGSRAERLSQDAERVTVYFGDQTLGAEALVGCDGVNSAVRALLWGAQPARFVGQIAWRGLVERHRLPQTAASLSRVWTGEGKHFVHYPVRNGALVNFVGVVHGEAGGPSLDPESWSACGDKGALALEFRNWPDPVPDLIGEVDAPWRFAIHDREPLRRWSTGRVTLLGDAAHPAPPFLAQGAAMAVEDAEALARHLTSGLPVDAALLAYEAERRGRTARAQSWARRNGALFHLPDLIARAVFGGAATVDRIIDPKRGSRRLDWLYGYQPNG